MDKLFEEIVGRALREEMENMELPSYDDLVIEMRCFEALKKIKAVLGDETLDDPECFNRIEEIVCIFEDLGSDGGGRHEF